MKYSQAAKLLSFVCALCSSVAYGQLTYQYDNLNRLTQVTYPCATTTYNYDAVGALESVTTTGEVKLSLVARLSNMQPIPGRPETEPYTALGYNFVGEPAYTGPPIGSWNYIDWIVVELRDANDPTVIVASKPVLLASTGLAIEPSSGSSPISFVSVCPGQYYVAVKHRNHLGVMSASPVSFSAGSSGSVNFAFGQTPTYGTHAQRDAGSFSHLWPGDTNGDGKITLIGASSDILPITIAILTDLANNSPAYSFVKPGYARTDATLDNQTRLTFSPPNLSDIIPITTSILNHPGNVGSNGQPQYSFTILEQLP